MFGFIKPLRAKDLYIRPRCTQRATTVHASKQPISLFHQQPSESSLSNHVYTIYIRPKSSTSVPRKNMPATKGVFEKLTRK